MKTNYLSTKYTIQLAQASDEKVPRFVGRIKRDTWTYTVTVDPRWAEHFGSMVEASLMALMLDIHRDSTITPMAPYVSGETFPTMQFGNDPDYPPRGKP